MEKTFIMRFDGTGAIYGNIKVSNLQFDIDDACVTLIRSSSPEALLSVISGDVVPHSGSLSLAGVNITERNKNERRVAVMPQEFSTRDVKKLLHDVLSIKTEEPNVYEVRENELKEKVRDLKKQLHEKSEDRAELSVKLKQTQIDLTALGLKMKRRQTELEQNLKTTKALLESVKKTSPIYVQRLEDKLFSAQFELCSYMHKAMPEGMIKSRIENAKKALDLSDVCSDTELAFACAYAKAPVLIACIDHPNLDFDILQKLCEKTHIPVVCSAQKDTLLSCENVIDVTDAHFTTIK